MLHRALMLAAAILALDEEESRGSYRRIAWIALALIVACLIKLTAFIAVAVIVAFMCSSSSDGATRYVLAIGIGSR